MAVIDTRLFVQPDGVVSSVTRLAAGEYLARLELQKPTGDHSKAFSMTGFLVRDIGWAGPDLLRREEMYSDDGR